MGRLQIAVGLSLVFLATICKQTYAVLPDVNQYTPQVVKPLFDLIRDYGLIEKNKSGKAWNQYLVVLIASHDEIITPVKNESNLREHFVGRVICLLNEHNDLLVEILNSNKKAHGEVRFIFDTNISNNMLNTFRKKYPKESPIILMYSYYIPCAGLGYLGYSCSEELAVYATYNWMHFGLLVAFSKSFEKTDDNAAVRFLRLGGIPTFRYTNSNSKVNLELVPDTNSNSNDYNRWRSVAFLPKFFDCLVNNVQDSCLGNTIDRNKILAFFVNSAAYECFKTMSFRWRAAKANEIQNSFNEYLQKNIGSDCKQCTQTCAALKQQAAQKCVETSVSNSLVSGELGHYSNPLDYTWKVSRDEELFKLFPVSYQTTMVQAGKNVSCKEKSLTPQSLCTKKGAQLL